jgi:hypothetical protein
MFFHLHPVFYWIGLSAVAAVVCVVGACLARRTSARWLLSCIALVLIAPAGWALTGFFPELVDARYRTYKGFYGDIQIGMSRDEVLELVRRRYPEGGRRQAPRLFKDTEGELGFFMNPEDSVEPNCEGIFLEMSAGKVASKDYSRD